MITNINIINILYIDIIKIFIDFSLKRKINKIRTHNIN